MAEYFMERFRENFCLWKRDRLIFYNIANLFYSDSGKNNLWEICDINKCAAFSDTEMLDELEGKLERVSEEKANKILSLKGSPKEVHDLLKIILDGSKSQ
ncbi:hypothetical protein HZA33_00705 [Candidatus Pacearchaeota archaeon]|nr:hypothetical protein [Candidatus Pacearchaeota archaeon]